MGLRNRDVQIIADGSEVLGQQDGVCYVYGKAIEVIKLVLQILLVMVHLPCFCFFMVC